MEGSIKRSEPKYAHRRDRRMVCWHGSPQIEIGQDALLLHHTFFSQPWQVGIVLSGDNNVNALNVTGDEFRAMGMQTLHPSMNEAVPAS